MWKFSYSFRIIAIFYFGNLIVAAGTIEGGNYLRKETICRNTVFDFKMGPPTNDVPDSGLALAQGLTVHTGPRPYVV